MGWRFWRKTERVEGATTAVVERPTPLPVADTPRTGGFSFDVTPPPPEPEPEPELAVEALEDVVRAKAANRRVATRIVRDRGIAPLLVPSLLPAALAKRDFASDPELAPNAASLAWRDYLTWCPDDVEGWFALGQAQLESGQPDGAWHAFEQARALEPGHRLALGALGYISQRRGAPADAVRFFAAAVEAGPDDLDMLAGLAEAQVAAGQPDDAARTRARIDAIERTR